jgi:hypothetical protein
MFLSKQQSKLQYSEAEAAAHLGITVDQLRSLVKHHIAKGDDDFDSLESTSFHASDLLILRILSSQAGFSPAGG